MADTNLNSGQLQKVIDVIYEKTGYDFGNYSKASFGRRLKKIIKDHRLRDHRELIEKLSEDLGFFANVLPDLTVSTTEMFRDPEVYKGIYERILPELATYPSIRIWHAGCSTGEEVYSFAILLKEYGIYDRCSIYATDIDERALARAKRGIYRPEELQETTKRYYRVGGKSPFSDYYNSNDRYFSFDPSLRNNVLFSTHNLAVDSSFGDFHLIVCRNVLIYFDRILQDRAIKLFNESLVRRGLLILGSKESIGFSSEEKNFETIDSKLRFFKKRGGLL